MKRLLFVALLFLISCAPSEPELTPEEMKEKLIELQRLGEQKEEIRKLAKATDDPLLCDQIATNLDLCEEVYRMPFGEAVETFCIERNICVGGILAERALKNKDPSICPTIPDPAWRTACYVRLAEALKDPELCYTAKKSARDKPSDATWGYTRMKVCLKKANT